MYIVLLLLNLFYLSISIIPNWNLKDSAKDLLDTSTSTNTYTYTVTHRAMYKLEAKLQKTLKRESNGIITQKNKLYINGTFKSEVSFENIESFYKTDSGKKLMCPIGKYDPINLNDMKEINNNIKKNNIWDLKCYNHNSGKVYFFAFYLMNGAKQVYDLNSDNSYTEYERLQLHSELYDFKLKNKEGKNEADPYPICALIKRNKQIQFLGTKYRLSDSNNIGREKDSFKSLIDAKTYSQGYFNNYTNDFYYITYNNISDFTCGYSTSTVSGSDYYSISGVSVSNNVDTPFEFIDDVEIEEMKFLLYTNYVYYTLKILNTDKKYHGILDVKTNKIMFNTDEDIDVFIPYSNNSMLVITSESAYRLCILKDSSGNCIEECTSGSIILSDDGNICGSSCASGKYLRIPEGVCVSECNTSIYMIDGTKCGLCRDLDSSKQYRIINSEECLSSKPDNTIYYNENLFLLECKSGYILNQSTCVPYCYEKCKTCSQYSTNENNQYCLTCIDGYYLDSADNNCKKIVIPCKAGLEEKCQVCNDESNELDLCVSCNTDYKKVNYTTLNLQYIDCLLENDPILKNFYYNETLDEFRPCYKNCKTCEREGDEENNYCLECATGYMFRPGNNPKNNCVVYSEFYYISPYNQYKPLEILQCPEESKFVIKNKKTCTDDCTKDDEYKSLYNGNCVNQCPEDTTNVNNKCQVNSNKCTLGENELNLLNNDIEVIGTLVKTYLSEFNYTVKHISLHKNENYTIMIYKTARCIKELSLEMPNINFKSCYEKVQSEYSIYEDLLIAIADKKAKNPKSFYSFFHPVSGIKLDADRICQNVTINVHENLNNLLDKNDSYYEAQASLVDQGINIFDQNDPFFTDICYDFDNPLKKDIPVSERITYFFPNVSLCDEGCQYKGINLEDMTSSCDCKFNDLSNNEFIKDSLIMDSMVGEIFEMLSSSNVLVLKCVKFIFNHFSRSIGGWISLGFIAGDISMVLLYFLIELPKMKVYIFSLMKRYISFITKKKPTVNFPPKKKKKIKRSNKSKRKLNHENNVSIFEKNKDKDIDAKSDKNILNNKNNNNKLLENKEKKDTNSLGNKKECKLIINDKKEKKDKKEDNDDKNDQEFFKEYLSDSVDDMEYDDAIVFDKRTFLELFKDNLHENQIIAHTFIANDALKPRTMKIIVFILNIMFYFVVNGLFFSEEVINELFLIDEEEENFFSYLPRSIERIFYCTLVSIVIGIITDLFFVGESKIKGNFKREENHRKELQEKIVIFIQGIQKKNIAFIVISSIILLFAFFYLLCFNYVYPYSQIEWIKSSITIVIIMQILSFLKCLLQSVIRILSFKLKSETLFKIGRLID